ncbi:unnamed protein product [Leptidea sinapis]|uniref:Uncharacterized protein n=1 Tax=Leptidea sinapis TaxID=189913 RepID=A0A5E4R5S2_9NEOP|nr:unnamed protein product [Leptidea sinapis]
MSDHRQMFVEIKKFEAPKKRKLEYKAINNKKLYNAVEDPHQSFTSLLNEINQQVEASKEYKTRFLNLPKEELITKNVINSIQMRNLRWTALHADPENEELVDEYKKQRALTAIAIRNTKDSYYYKEFQKCVKK